MEFNDDKEDSKLNSVKLGDTLKDAGIEHRKEKDEADKRACATEIKREDLLKKLSTWKIYPMTPLPVPLMTSFLKLVCKSTYIS